VDSCSADVVVGESPVCIHVQVVAVLSITQHSAVCWMIVLDCLIRCEMLALFMQCKSLLSDAILHKHMITDRYSAISIDSYAYAAAAAFALDYLRNAVQACV
jgi:hypothetical protein